MLYPSPPPLKKKKKRPLTNQIYMENEGNAYVIH